MKKIESRENPIIKKALKAVKGNFDSQPMLLVEGEKLISEAIASGAEAIHLFVTDAASAKEFPELESRCCILSAHLFKELSSVKTQARIIAFFAPPPSVNLETILNKYSSIVVLDRLQDPGNMGTIMRTCEAMGVEGIILLKGCCNQYNHKLIRAAMGSNFRLPVCADVDPCHLLSSLKKSGISIICADMNGSSLFNFSFPDRCAMFFGQEGQGLDTKILKECTDRLAIPMQGQVESLNVAASAAICLYELAKSRCRKN